MVSLLHLPRFFVYHSGIVTTSSSYNLFLLKEKGLIKIIAISAMMLTSLSGITFLTINISLLYENYFIIKLLFVLTLIIYQIYLIKVFAFKKKINKRSAKFYKLITVIPPIFIIIIILFVVLKPNLG